MILDANGMPILQPAVDNAETATFNTAFAAVGTAFSGFTGTREIQTFVWADNAARTAQTGMTAGDEGYQTDTDTVYRYDGTSWNAAGSLLATGRVVRSSSTPSVASGSYTNISANANWSTTAPAAQNEGFAAYSDGWTIPATGVYRVSFSLANVGNIGTLSGVSVNKSSGIAYTDLFGLVSADPVGAVTAPVSSFEQHFTIGDVLRLFAYGDGGSPSLTASRGAFSVTWVRA